MSLIDKKKNIFTTIGAYSSMGDTKKQPEPTIKFSSINNGKDIVPLLLDILKVTVGSKALQDLTGEVFGKFIDIIEPQLKTTLKNQTIQYNSNDKLPNDFKQNGYEIPLKNIDINNKFKVDPKTKSGNLVYDQSVPSFDNSAYDAIQNSGTDIKFGNLSLNYNNTSNSFNYKPNLENNSDPSISDFTTSFIDNTTIINKKEFITKTLNSIYGTISNTENKTLEEISNELQVEKMIENLINDDDSFSLTSEELNQIQKDAEDIRNGGIYYDMGCGLMEAKLSIDDFANLINSISGSTDTHGIGKALNDSIDKSLEGNEGLANNSDTVRDGFFSRLFKKILNTLVQAITTAPQIRTILGIVSGFQNNGKIDIGNPKEDLKKFKAFLICMIKKAMEMLNKFIYDIVVGFLISLITPLLKKIVKEKINQYSQTIKSLTKTNLPKT